MTHEDLRAYEPLLAGLISGPRARSRRRRSATATQP